jgi:hypothetical protein
MLRTERHFRFFNVKCSSWTEKRIGDLLIFFDLTPKLLLLAKLVYYLEALHSRDDGVGTHAVNMC